MELLSLARSIPDIRDCFSTHHEHYVVRVRALLIEACVTAPEPPEEALPRADAAALALASVIDGLVLRWTLASTPFDLEQRLWEAAEVIIQGVRQPAA